MAGWIEWDQIDIAAQTSAGQTVLETLWPAVKAIAQNEGWANWVGAMQVEMTASVMGAKSAEFPTLRGNDDMVSAIAVGEIWAATTFHTRVSRFDTIAAAENWLMNWVRGQARPQLSAVVKDRMRNHPHVWKYLDLADVAGMPALQNAAERVVLQWNTVTFAAFVVILYYRSQEMAPDNMLIQSFVHYVCGLSKMGNMTEQWRRSRQNQIRKDTTDPDLEISKTVASLVWDYYGVAYKPAGDQFEALFQFLEDHCRAKGLTRLFVTAKQSAEQGFAVCKFIQDAKRMFSDFNWGRFITPHSAAEREIQMETGIWANDFQAMIENPWARFAGAAGRSTEYVNLGYLCKELLSRAGGVMAVSSYKGLDAGTQTIRYRAWIDATVSQYIQEVQANDAVQRAIVPARNNEGVIDPGLNPPVRDRVADAYLPEMPTARGVLYNIVYAPGERVFPVIVDGDARNAPVAV